jgi:hypothetical protein
MKEKQKMFKKQVVDKSNGDAKIDVMQKKLQCMSKHGDHCNLS